MTDDLAISFQRFPYPGTGIVEALPTSCGALPIYRAGPGHLIVPSLSGEALWVALLGTPGAHSSVVRVLASIRDGVEVDVFSGIPVPAHRLGFATTVTLPPHRFVPGIRRGDGTWWALARAVPRSSAPACNALTLIVRSGRQEAAAPATEPATPMRHHTPGGQEPREGRLGPRFGAGNQAGTIDLYIEFTNEEVFTRASGQQVPPLRPDRAYGDWRLP